MFGKMARLRETSCDPYLWGPHSKAAGTIDNFRTRSIDMLPAFASLHFSFRQRVIIWNAAVIVIRLCTNGA